MTEERKLLMDWADEWFQYFATQNGAMLCDDAANSFQDLYTRLRDAEEKEKEQFNYSTPYGRRPR